MKAYLYVTNSEKEEINKVLNSKTEIDIALKRDTTIIDPTLILSGTLDNISGYNYFYIPEFKRYYFLTDLKVVRNQLYELKGHVDVLMSFKTQILNNPAIIERSTSTYDLYLQDSEFNIESYRQIQTKKFNFEFKPETNLILSVIGGGE